MPNDDFVNQHVGLRSATYGRFSSDMQRPASLEDQERNCRALIADKRMVVVEDYVLSDAAQSGKHTFKRAGLNRLLAAAKQRPRPFDYIVIDDTSRLGRNVADVLKMHEVLKYHQVDLYFVAQRLDARDPNFSTLFNLYATQDQLLLERLAKAVHRGQEGRVRKGFISGGAPFGYKVVRLFNPANPEDFTRANSLGSDLRIIESEAETIKRIYEMFVGGLSVHRIAMILDKEGVPAATKPRIGDLATSWNSNLVGRILKNEKYIGVNVWNRTKQYTNPETGTIETRKKSESDVVRVPCERWRIVSDEQWNAVRTRFTTIKEKTTARRLAGINRGQRKDYLFSGLLECSVCHGPIVITGGKGVEASYGCRLARYKRGCDNRLRIRADRFSNAMVDAMQECLLSDDTLEQLVESVYHEMVQMQEQSRKDAERVDANALADEVKKIDEKVEKYIRMIDVMDVEDAVALAPRLAQAEVERRRLTQLQQTRLNPNVNPMTKGEVRGEVLASASRLKELLFADVVQARAVLQQFIQKLVLVPTDSVDGPIYEVIGSVELFATQVSESHVMLGGSGTATYQLYAAAKFSFAAIFADPRREFEQEVPVTNSKYLVKLLLELLQREPELAGQRLYASVWGRHLRLIAEEDGHTDMTMFESKSFTWLVDNYGTRFEEFLRVTVGKNGHTGTKTFSFQRLHRVAA